MNRIVILILAGIDLFCGVIPSGILYIHYVNAPHPEPEDDHGPERNT